MTREMKFRAWDKLSGMIHFEFYDLQMNIVNPDHGVYDVPIMQYTGLKDYSGKEIYEDDIGEGEHATYLIKWNEEKAQYQAKIIKTKSVLAKNLSFPLWQYVDDDGKCRFLVIGNIYENSDLVGDSE